MINNVTIIGKCISKDNEKVFGKFTRRPFLSAKYKSYAIGVAYQAKNQCKQALVGDLKVDATFYMPNKVHSDLTNCPKGIFDALNGIVWEDDKQIKECHLYIKYDKNNPRVVIRAEEI